MVMNAYGEISPPIFTFDANGSLEIFQSVDDLDGFIEPLFVEELYSAFDSKARPVEIAIDTKGNRIELGTSRADLGGLKESVARVPWILAEDLPGGDVSVAEYVDGLISAYDRAVERDSHRKRPWYCFNRGE
jgi:hypothetical protein